MTIGPDELAEIRAEADQETYGDRTIRALCDALDRVQADLDALGDYVAKEQAVIDAARALDRNWHVDSLRLHHAAAVVAAVAALDSGEPAATCVNGCCNGPCDFDGEPAATPAAADQ